MSDGVLVVQEPVAQLVIAGDTPVTLQVVEERVALVSVAEQGPSGPEGQTGAAGQPGRDGAADIPDILDGGNF